jgi:hypothetical protein
MSYVITCGDEGVQLNQGTRLGVVGAGFQLDHFSDLIKGLKKVISDEIFLVASEENDWVKKHLDLANWEQTNASFQQHAQALADKEKVIYAGFLPFADPKALEKGIKGHMVRPHGIHIANKICFTLAGGEQTYNLGSYVISAEWVSQVKPEIAKEILKTQVDFYTSLAKQPLKVIFEEKGELGEKVAEANKKALEKLGYKAE